MHDKPSDKALEMAYRSMGEYVKRKYATALGIGKPASRTRADVETSSHPTPSLPKKNKT